MQLMNLVTSALLKRGSDTTSRRATNPRRGIEPLLPPGNPRSLTGVNPLARSPYQKKQQTAPRGCAPAGVRLRPNVRPASRILVLPPARGERDFPDRVFPAPAGTLGSTSSPRRPPSAAGFRPLDASPPTCFRFPF